MSVKHNVLLFEEKPDISGMFRSIFNKNDYRITVKNTVEECIKIIKTEEVDILLINHLEDSENPVDTVREFRKITGIPVAVILHRCSDDMKIRLMEEGADAYFEKPFNLSLLSANVKTIVRRSTGYYSNLCHDTVYMSGDLKIDFGKRRAMYEKKDIHLTRVEFRLMEELCKNPGRVVTHKELITSIWGMCLTEDSKILRVNIRNIRRKLKENASRPRYIFTEMGIGYRVAEETV